MAGSADQRTGKQQRYLTNDSRPSRHFCRPPWSRIDGFSVLSELDIEFRGGVSISWGRSARHLGLAHCTDRLPCQHGLTGRNADSTHTCQDHMIAVARVQDQELTVRSEGSRVAHIPVGRCSDDGAGLCCNRVAMHHSAVTVIVAKTARDAAGHGECDLLHKRRERLRPGEPIGLGNRHRGNRRLALQPLLLGASGLLLGRADADDLLLDRSNQILQAAGLGGKLRALARSSERAACSPPAVASSQYEKKKKACFSFLCMFMSTN